MKTPKWKLIKNALTTNMGMLDNKEITQEVFERRIATLSERNERSFQRALRSILMERRLLDKTGNLKDRQPE